MQKFVRLDGENKVIGIRYGASIVDGEIQSEQGDIGDIKQGKNFIKPLYVEPVYVPTQLDQIEAMLIKLTKK
jgi:hypothetical protein